jgi:hypothetical protein
MRKDPFAYKIIVWHNTCTHGTHNRILFSASTPEKALKELSKYLERPAQYRSFTDKNLVQLHGPDGLICNIPAITE